MIARTRRLGAVFALVAMVAVVGLSAPATELDPTGSVATALPAVEMAMLVGGWSWFKFGCGVLSGAAVIGGLATGGTGWVVGGAAVGLICS